MATSLSQNAPIPPSSLRRDFSSVRTATFCLSRTPSDADNQATLALPYTGGVAAQSAVDYTADPDELITGSLEMHSGKTPRSLPSGFPMRSRHPSTVSAAFSGDPNSSFPSNYTLSGDSQSGSQHSRTEIRQTIDLSSDPSQGPLHFATDLPWNPVAAAEEPSGSISTNLPEFRTPNRILHPYTQFQNSTFHDSAIGTITAPSHDETHSLMSSPLTDMDTHYNYGYPQPQEVYQNEEPEVRDVGGAQIQPPQEQPVARAKIQRQQRTTEELTCETCAHVSKTPSDLKYVPVIHPNIVY